MPGPTMMTGVVALKGRRNWDLRTNMGTRALQPFSPAGSLARSQLVATPLLIRPDLVSYSTTTAQMCTELAWTWRRAGVSSTVVPEAPFCHQPCHLSCLRASPYPSWCPTTKSPFPVAFLTGSCHQGWKQCAILQLAYWDYCPVNGVNCPRSLGQSWSRTRGSHVPQSQCYAFCKLPAFPHLGGRSDGVVAGLQPRQQLTQVVDGGPQGWVVLQDGQDVPPSLHHPAQVQLLGKTTWGEPR